MDLGETSRVPSPHFVNQPQSAHTTDETFSSRVAAAVEQTREWLFARQHADGHWCGELEGDSILESEYILLLAWLGQEQSPIARKCAAYLVEKQLPAGGWNMYPGGKLEISGSVKAYFALKLTGHDPQADYMRLARQAIRTAGGADAVNSFTRFYLALLGQISYAHCPAVPPEIVLLPQWSPINIYRMSAWSRTIVVPLSIMWAFRPERKIAKERGISELFLRHPDQWPALQCPGLSEEKSWFSWGKFFRQADATLKWLEARRWRPLRRRALSEAERWMTTRFAHSDGLGAIFPPIIWSVIALKCLGYDDDSAEVRYNFDQLKALTIEQQHTARLQPCLSPVWDTALALRALAVSGVAPENPGAERATKWLLDKEITRRGDWATYVSALPAGWFFEYHNEFYPDVDDTAMVMIALAELKKHGSEQVTLTRSVSEGLETRGEGRGERGQKSSVANTQRGVPLGTPSTKRGVTAACERARKWILAMQNRDGGWGAFDRDNDAEFLCRVPFADHNAMIDPSTPDLAGRSLEALALWDQPLDHAAMQRGVQFLRSTQERDGAWLGRWGVNYIYGTWQALVGLTAAGVLTDDPAIKHGANWFLSHQHACGGWGESADSYEQPELRGQGAVTASQTAWALLGLMAAGLANHPAVERGIYYLLDTQRPDGAWDELEFTGTGFPRVFYLRYHYYPVYFPLLALAQFQRGTRSGERKAEQIQNSEFRIQN
jgi:squalene-hopene/tetraprenyl-beta-curcumene cyclase